MASNDDPTNVEQIRSNIAQTRAQMSDALDAIQEKLSPQALADQAQAAARGMAQGAMTAIQDHIDPRAIADQVSGVVQQVTSRSVTTMVNNAQDAAKSVGSSLLDRVRQNPLPLALIGVGVGLLVAQEPLRRAQDQVAQVAHQAQDTTSHLANQAQDAAGQLASQAQDTAGEIAGRVQDATGQLVGQARTQAEHAGSWLQTTVRENPVAVGAGMLALGAVVGLMIPETEQEHQVMGQARDALVGRAQAAAQAAAQDTLQKAQRVAEETQAAAQRAAREQGLLPS